MCINRYEQYMGAACHSLAQHHPFLHTQIDQNITMANLVEGVFHTVQVRPSTENAAALLT